MQQIKLDHDTFNLIIREPVFNLMANTIENSPYHREDNVFVHTLMVCDWYKERVSESEDWFFLGLFACLLHDVAKPVCRVRKENKERGVYYGYDRHDTEGAILAENMLVKIGVSEFDIYRIKWMIEHHAIFWNMKDNFRRSEIARILRNGNFYLPFKFFMLADTNGRIADNPRIDLDEKTIKEFETLI